MNFTHNLPAQHASYAPSQMPQRAAAIKAWEQGVACCAAECSRLQLEHDAPCGRPASSFCRFLSLSFSLTHFLCCCVSCLASASVLNLEFQFGNPSLTCFLMVSFVVGLAEALNSLPLLSLLPSFHCYTARY